MFADKVSWRVSVLTLIDIPAWSSDSWAEADGVGIQDIEDRETCCYCIADGHSARTRCPPFQGSERYQSSKPSTRLRL